MRPMNPTRMSIRIITGTSLAYLIILSRRSDHGVIMDGSGIGAASGVRQLWRRIAGRIF